MDTTSNRTRGTAVPILMYHSVGRVLPDWRWSDLTVPWRIFEDHLAWLRRAGYHTVSLADVHDHVAGVRALDDRSVVLTFDDGYVDNWTYAAPLLEKYGFSGTVLVTPEFVDPRDIVRPTLADVWKGAVAEGELEVRAFMSWDELRAASESETLDAQCHAMTHTWYPASDRVVGFHHPGDGCYWLDWNAHPQGKPYYLEEPDQSSVPWGTPIYAHEKSLAVRRYYPDPEEEMHMVAYVAANGGEELFRQDGWAQRLHAELEDLRERRGPSRGRHESDEERASRLRVELEDSRRAIESRVGRPVEYFIWPGGGYDDEAMAVARRIYRAVTISSREREFLGNRPGEDAGQIIRRGIPGIDVNGQIHYLGGRYLIQFIEEFKGSRVARKHRQVLKALHMVAARAGVWPRDAGASP